MMDQPVGSLTKGVQTTSGARAVIALSGGMRLLGAGFQPRSTLSPHRTMRSKTIGTALVCATGFWALACTEASETKASAVAEAPSTAAPAPGSGASLIVASPDLLARARVTDEAARATALAAVPGGAITAAELEEEGGSLIYSYDVSVPGRDGVEEVHVDAVTGKVLSTEHEGAAEEADEDETGRK